MPSYLYRCECGEEIAREFPMNNFKKKVKCRCGKMAKKAFTKPNGIGRYSMMDRARGAARIGRGKGV